MNSLNDVKREMINKRKELKTENKLNNNFENFSLGLASYNLNKMYIPEKELLRDKKHEFERLIEKEPVDNLKNYSLRIPQMVRNKNVKIFKPTNKKVDFIEKNYYEIKQKKLKFHISFEDNKEYFNEFDDDLINKIISNIKEKENENKNYDIITESPIIPQSLKKINFKKKYNRDYIIKDLLESSHNYMEKFLETISKTNINFNKTSFCFIIDCSLYLGIKLKLLNFIIISSMIKILYIIDIQFSILLSADDKYKVIIKNYDQNIDYEDLMEILYETIIIKRFRNNILKTIKTAINYLKNDKRNTIYVTFFDCMDESLTYPNFWMKTLLNDKTNIFILIAEKSRLFKDTNRDIINNMIKNFDETIKNKTESKLKLLFTDFENQDVNFIISSLFSDLLLFLNDINEEIVPNTSINYSSIDKKENKIKNGNNLHIKELEYFEELINSDNYKNYDKIYFFNNARKKQKINLPESLDKIESFEIPKYSKKDFPKHKFFSSLLNRSIHDKTLIESIFYPNKATQKQLSTKGTEIDFIELILYTLQPVQEPKIYLENKGGLIRDYSITVIIDNSMSCFSEFNEKHSFLTIINLFHIINSMAIPSLDILLPSKEGEFPDIILFDKPSISIFKNYSIFEHLLSLISNPSLNTDLSEALKVVYELKRMKKNNRESYLFILTDGLSSKNYEKK